MITTNIHIYDKTRHHVTISEGPSCKHKKKKIEDFARL